LKNGWPVDLLEDATILPRILRTNTLLEDHAVSSGVIQILALAGSVCALSSLAAGEALRKDGEPFWKRVTSRMLLSLALLGCAVVGSAGNLVPQGTFSTLAEYLLFLARLLRNLPDLVLAAIVLVAVRGLIGLRRYLRTAGRADKGCAPNGQTMSVQAFGLVDRHTQHDPQAPTGRNSALSKHLVSGLLSALRHLWRVSPMELKIAMVALVGVLLLGILKGVLLAAVAALLMLIASMARTHVAFLGRISSTRR
jgi:hypothetical protein